MSARGIGQAAGFGPGTCRRAFAIGHVEVVVNSHSDYGVTFGLRTLHGPEARPWLFSGHVEAGMPADLRRLADYLDTKAGGA